MAIVHELSWSTSRAGTFATCKRRYYHDYYGSWRGWERQAPEAARRAYLLKKMTRMPMLAGDALHRSLEAWFEGEQQGQVGPAKEVLERALGFLRQGYKESRDGLWRERPAKLTHLAEHHYSEPVIDEKSGAAGEYGGRYVERLRKAVEHFFEHPSLAEVRDAQPRSFLGCEQMGTIELYGTKVYAVPDFAFRTDEGEVRIYDWKTGRPRAADRFQLIVYALYAEAKWGTDPERTTCVDAYLATGEEVRLQPGRAELDEVLGRIETSMEGMRAVHFDADQSAGDIEAFERIAEGAPEVRECASCNYRELCDRA